MTDESAPWAWRPLAERLRQPFLSLDRVNGLATYSRACSVTKKFVLVRVIWDPETGKQDRKALTPSQRRFLDKNITPDEAKAARLRAKNGR